MRARRFNLGAGPAGPRARPARAAATTRVSGAPAGRRANAGAGALQRLIEIGPQVGFVLDPDR
jgi:hypothetical protein